MTSMLTEHQSSASFDEKFIQAMHQLQTAYTDKSQEYEMMVTDMQKQIHDKNEYIKRLEKRNAELEKHIIDIQSRLGDTEARLGYKDGRIRELESKVDSLEKIRKDILTSVHQMELPMSYNPPQQQQLITDENTVSIRKERNLPYSGPNIQSSQTLALDSNQTFAAIGGGGGNSKSFQTLESSIATKENINVIDFPLVSQKQRKSHQISTSIMHPSTSDISSIDPSSRSGIRQAPQIPQIDAKVYFKNVKARLSEEQFNEFLINVKKCNGKIQNRDETLRNVARLFGKDNEDLYQNFEIIVCPHLISGNQLQQQQYRGDLSHYNQ